VTDVRTYKEVQKFDHELYKCSSNTNRLCISSNSRYVVVGSQNGNVIIYDMKTQELEEIYDQVHKTAIVACEWQPRGTKFASIDNLGSLFIWQPQ
jgi:WD40 repeat protein